jgi:ribonuclease HI
VPQKPLIMSFFNVIFLGGQKEHRYSWGLGHKTNNQAKIMAAFKGLTLIPKDKYQSIIVIGDS